MAGGCSTGLSRSKLGRKHFSHLAKFSLFPSRMELKPTCIYLASSEWKTREGLAREEWRTSMPGEGLPGDIPPCSAHLPCPPAAQASCCWPFWYVLLLLLLSSHPQILLKKTHLTWKVSGENPGLASRRLPANAREPEQRPGCMSRLHRGGLAATSFPDTTIPSGCKADVNSPSAARWCKGKSLHGKAPVELTSRLFPAPKSQRSCSPLISVCHN